MNTRTLIVSLFVAMLTLHLPAMEEEKGMETTFSVGVTLTDGNSETLQGNASIISEGEKEGLGSVRFGAEGNYGKSRVDGQRDTTTENAKVFGNAKKTLSEMTFAYLDGSVLYDDMAEVDYRVIVGPGMGFYLIKNDDMKLSIEGGLSYVWEEVADESDDYLAFRLAERFEYKLTETAKIWQSIEYLPQVDDFKNNLITAELGVEAPLSTRMSLRFVLQDTYNSTPGEGLKHNDVTLISGISVKL